MRFEATIYGADPRIGEDRTKSGRLKAGSVTYERSDISAVLEQLAYLVAVMSPEHRRQVVRIVIEAEAE